ALKQNYEKPPRNKETEQWKVEHSPVSPREIPGLSSPSTPHQQCLRGGRLDAPIGREHRLAKGRPRLPGQKFGYRWAQTGRVVVEERSNRGTREVSSKSRRARLAAERLKKKRRKERRREEKLEKDKEDGQWLYDVEPTDAQCNGVCGGGRISRQTKRRSPGSLIVQLSIVERGGGKASGGSFLKCQSRRRESRGDSAGQMTEEAEESKWLTAEAEHVRNRETERMVVMERARERRQKK
ncbi:hypothetical protein KFL_013620010, partial [Klebsormidium nitens]